MLDCWTLITSCYAASPPSIPPVSWRCLYHIFVFWKFDLFFAMLRCLIFFISCYTAWPWQLYVMWLQVEQFLYAARSWLHDAGLLDLFCLMLFCLICPASCYAAIWFDLHSARLLDLPNRMLCFGCSLFHVMLFDLVIKALRCLILSNSCATFLTFPCFVVSCSLHHVKFLFLKPGLHDAFSTSCYAPWPSLPHVMLLNVLCIILC